MNLVSRIKRISAPNCGGWILILALAGCGRGNQVKVQRVPKDADTTPAVQPGQTVSAPGAMDFHPAMGAASAEQVKWTLPAGWEEKPLSEMRVGSFSAKGTNGQAADVSVIPLPSSGREADFVNMWRQQMQLPSETANAADNGAEPVTIGSDSGKLYDISSERPILDGKQNARMLVATITRGGTSWFFKMAGEKNLVGEQKPAFLQFLKTISFAPAAEMSAANPHALMSDPAAAETTADNSVKPASWTVPAGWQELPATEFLVAKYQITGADGATAEASASVFGGTAGGVLANVNRWRGQLGLPPILAADLPAQSSSLEVPGGAATLVDLTGADKAGQKTRLIGAILPQGGQTWFYKLMGDEKLAGEQKDAFIKYMQSAKYANAQ